MGLFRRNRAIEVPEPEPIVVVEEKKIKVVILTFPPNLEALTPEARNPKLVFQHETDSVVSSVSNCSCRMAHGRRRPECCQSCLEMKQSMSRRDLHRPSALCTTHENSDEKAEPILFSPPTQLLGRAESAKFYSPRNGHKISPALKFFSKIVIPSRTHGGGGGGSTPTSSDERSSMDELQLAMLTAPSFSPPRRHHRKSRSAGNFFFGKQQQQQADAGGLNQSQSMATDELSLDHELS